METTGRLSDLAYVLQESGHVDNAGETSTNTTNWLGIDAVALSRPLIAEHE